ncbi:MAG: hypothetical protein KOO69_00495 [Victivallales bacterium]|nr:hypothetical protein [Victivallales bacterium]
MRLQKIILIFFIACFLNMEVISVATRNIISNRTDSSELLSALSNLNNEQDILDDILFTDIEETEVDENKRIRKNRKALFFPYLLSFISHLKTNNVTSCKKIMSVSEFQHDYNSKLQSMILLL